jgi:trk system potassium uptake protein TrkH
VAALRRSTALRARPAVVSAALALQAPILLAVVLPPMVVAIPFGEFVFAASLIPQCALLAVVSVMHRSRTFPDDLRRIEAFVVFALIFVIASLFIMPAFWVLGMGAVDALFEAVSGITSTGLSVAAQPESWPVVGHLMRGWIQWCGGFAIAFAGLALFAGSSGASLSMSSTNIAQRDNLSSAKVQARGLLKAYSALTVLAVLSCLLVLPNWWEALSVALAAVSTGGFAPRSDSLASYTPLAQGVVIAICVSSAISLIFYTQIFRDGLRQALEKSHVVATLVMMAVGVLAYICVDMAANDARGIEVYTGALNFLSAFTTAGFSTGELSGSITLLPLLLLAMLIGGDVGSTGGGIKVARIMVLASMVRLSLLRVTLPPGAVTYLREGGKKVEVDRVIGVTALLAMYLVTMLLCWTVFLVSGIDPLGGLFEVVSALSTVGLSQGVTSADLAPHLKLTLVAAMMLGRLEFIALIVLCLPGTWLKRN